MPKIKNYSRVKNSKYPTWDHDSKPLRVSVTKPSSSMVREDFDWEVMIYRTDKKQRKMAKQERRPGKGVNLVNQFSAQTKSEAMEKAKKWMRNHPKGV